MNEIQDGLHGHIGDGGTDGIWPVMWARPDDAKIAFA